MPLGQRFNVPKTEPIGPKVRLSDFSKRRRTVQYRPTYKEFYTSLTLSLALSRSLSLSLTLSPKYNIGLHITFTMNIGEQSDNPSLHFDTVFQPHGQRA